MKKNSVKLSGLIALMVILLGNMSCVELFEVKLGLEERLMVVESKFTTDKDQPHQLKLFYTSTVGSNIGEAIFRAKVTLFDTAGNQEDFIEMGNGRYDYNSSIIQGVPGNSYYIQIILENGNTYRSSPQIMPSRVKADSLSFSFDQIQVLNEISNVVSIPVVNITVNTPLSNNGEVSWLRWEMNEVYSFPEVKDPNNALDISITCYFREITDPQRLDLFTNENSEIDRIDNFLIARKKIDTQSDEKFRGLHYFNAYQHSISQDAFQYWEKVKKISNQQGNIFDPTPATVRGNIFNVNDPDEKVLGFFEVAVIDTIRVGVIPSLIRSRFNIRGMCPGPNFDFTRSVPNSCYTCTILPSYFLDRPPWF